MTLLSQAGYCVQLLTGRQIHHGPFRIRHAVPMPRRQPSCQKSYFEWGIGAVEFRLANRHLVSRFLPFLLQTILFLVVSGLIIDSASSLPNGEFQAVST